MNKRLPDSVIARKPAKRFAPMPSAPIAGTWRPVFTEQQQKEHDKYVQDHQLPF